MSGARTEDNECLMAWALAEIRQVVGVNEKPMLSDLPQAVSQALINARNAGVRDAIDVVNDRAIDDGDGDETAEDACFCIARDLERLIQ